MAKSLEQILGYEAMLGLVEAVKAGVPDVIPPSFMAPRRSFPNERGKYVKVNGTRETAQLVQYASPSVRRGLDGVSTVAVTIPTFYEHILHEPEALANITNYDNPNQQRLGEQEINRQTGLFFQRFQNVRLSMFYSALSLGHIYFDSEGNLLASSSNAVTDIDFGVSSDHKDQLGGIIGDSWATASTDIIGDMEAIKIQAVEDTGYQLAHAFYGTNILKYFLTNTLLKELINRNPGYQQAAAAGEIPQGFLGLQWHPAYTAMYKDADGTYQKWFGADTIVFTPEPSADWFEWLEGGYSVPTSINVSANIAEALSQVQQVTGFFTWCELSSDPLTIKQYGRDMALPVLKVPDAIFIADVTP